MRQDINGVDDEKLYSLSRKLVASLGIWGVGVGLHFVDLWTIAIEGYMINGAVIRMYISPTISYKGLAEFEIVFAHRCLEASEL